MLNQFQEIEDKFLEVEKKISDPEVISDQKKYQELVRKHAELREGVDLFRTYKTYKTQFAEAKEMQDDPELAEMAEEELDRLRPLIPEMEEKLRLFLIPPDPDDHKNAIVEVRSGTGGDEAALFAGDLYRMYTRYAETQGWKVEVLSENLTGLGGVKEIVFAVSGTGVYRRLKFESGTHRVQRVPETEASGRIHTSAATVAVLPEAEEVDVQIDTKDLRVDTYRASGAGGQHVNKTSSAVRITHLPSGVVVACQDERSQFQNKDKAMRMLRAKLYELQQEEKRKTKADLRKNQVGSGDRSEKIRTYNFPQNRLTDHRIGLTLHSMSAVLSGDMDDVFDALIQAEQLAKMKQ